MVRLWPQQQETTSVLRTLFGQGLDLGELPGRALALSGTCWLPGGIKSTQLASECLLLVMLEGHGTVYSRRRQQLEG